jgi:VanZ family protein
MSPGRLLAWVLLAAWLLVIWQFGESQVLQVGAADPAFRWVVRKSVHLVVYGVLGGLLALALGARRGWRAVLALCLVVAFADEMHQSFVPSRAFTVRDLGLDMLGGLIGATAAGWRTVRTGP